MLNSVTNNNSTAPIQKQVVQNRTNSDSRFQQELNKQSSSIQTSPSSPSEIKLAKDGSFILDKDAIQVIKVKEQRPVTTQEVQNELGVSKAEADKILNEFKLFVPVDYSPKEGEVSIKDLVEGSRSLKEMKIREAEAEKIMAEQMSPAGQKKYLMSKQVDVVARDAAGNIVAKIYKDGSLMCSNSLANGLINCTSNLERIRFLEKQSNIIISDYTKEKMTDFDLLKEEVALTQKNMLLHPRQLVFNTQEERDFYNTQREVFEFQKRILAA